MWDSRSIGQAWELGRLLGRVSAGYGGDAVCLVEHQTSTSLTSVRSLRAARDFYLKSQISVQTLTVSVHSCVQLIKVYINICTC